MKTLILDYMEATAARLPEKTAFADENSSVTFSALVARAKAVASALCGYVPPRSVIGFYMDKGVDTAIGFMGAVYAGCAYSLLNLRHPAARIAGADVSGQCVEVLHALGISDVALADLLDADAVPDERFQMALMLKLLPLLERQRAGAADVLLRRVRAEFLVISFPTRTLGGRDVGMERHYSEWMEAHLPAGRAVAARIVGENELFYILKEN